MVPQTTIPVDGGEATQVLRLIEALEDLDDVQNVYANFDIPEEVMASLCRSVVDPVVARGLVAAGYDRIAERYPTATARPRTPPVRGSLTRSSLGLPRRSKSWSWAWGRGGSCDGGARRSLPHIGVDRSPSQVSLARERHPGRATSESMISSPWSFRRLVLTR